MTRLADDRLTAQIRDLDDWRRRIDAIIEYLDMVKAVRQGDCERAPRPGTPATERDLTGQ